MGNLDCRPSHNFMVDDNGVKYCTACGEDYDNLGNKDSCSGSDWVRRHNTRKPNRVESSMKKIDKLDPLLCSKNSFDSDITIFLNFLYFYIGI